MRKSPIASATGWASLPRLSQRLSFAAAAPQESPAFLIGTIIFIATMWLLYLSSTLYHAWPQTRLKCVLQVLDHSAIFGVVMKLRRGLRWKKLSLALYLGMGWLILIAFRPFMQAVPLEAVIWLFAGGVAYTAGTIFFVNQGVRYNHFVWHLFVLGGTTCHFCAIFSCVA